MIKNYIKIALRNLGREKLYAGINILGLSVGIACCILIGLYILDEQSFDRIHEDWDRVYMMGAETHFPSDSYESLNLFYDDGTELSEYSGIESLSRIDPFGSSASSVTVEVEGVQSIETGNILFTESTFFSFFDFGLVEGNPLEVLANPNSVVITKRAARKYFGEESPLGKPLRLQENGRIQTGDIYEVTVTGLVENPPHNSSIQFDFLLSLNSKSDISSNSNRYQTFVRLHEDTSPDIFEGHNLSDYGMAFIEGEAFPLERTLIQIPFSDYYLSDFNSEEGFLGDRVYLRFFGLIAIVILLIACINYMNLSTARMTRRTADVGVRQTFGASRRQLIGQFLGESLIFSFLALAVAVFLAELFLPLFNSFFDKSLDLNLFQDPYTLLGLITIALVTGLISGSYPAWRLSSNKPVNQFRPGIGGLMTGSAIRNSLVVGQFIIAVVLIVGALVSSGQIRYMNNKDLGFNPESVLTVEIVDSEQRGQFEVFKQAIMQHSWASAVSGAEFWPEVGGGINNLSPMPPFQIRDGDLDISPSYLEIDEGYSDVMDLDLVAGRFFSPDILSDREVGIVLNESAVQAFGYSDSEEIVGETFGLRGFPENNSQVLGVVRDFHVAGFRNEIPPAVFHMQNIRFNNTESRKYVSVRYSGVSESELLESVRQNWSEVFPGLPIRYEFMDDAWKSAFSTDQKFQEVIIFFTLIAILIACMGLFSLVAYNVEQRVREIGIRKVLGATVGNITRMISRDFLKLVVIGFVVAAPIGHWLMTFWLEDFVYRIDIGPWIYISAGLMILTVAILAVIGQSLRAARMNPADSLRTE